MDGHGANTPVRGPERRWRGLLFGSLFVAAAAAVLVGTLAVVRAQGLPERTASLAALVAFVACVAGGAYLLVALDRR